MQNNINQNLNVMSDEQTQSTVKLDNSQLNPNLFNVPTTNNQVDLENQGQPQVPVGSEGSKIFQPVFKEKPDVINQTEALLKRLENLEAQNKELLFKLSQPTKEQPAEIKQVNSIPTNEAELTERLKAELLKEIETKSAKTLEAKFHEQRLAQIVNETNATLLSKYSGVDTNLVSEFYRQTEANYGKEFFRNIKVETIKPTIELLFEKFYKDTFKSKDGSGHTLPQGGEINQLINQKPLPEGVLNQNEKQVSNFLLKGLLEKTGKSQEQIENAFRSLKIIK